MRQLVHGYVPGAKPIFGTFHPPVGPRRSVAHVICPPLGWESIQCYHGLRLLGEILAAAGLPVLRLAYHGTGESAGRDEDPGRLGAWIESVHQAADWLSALPGVRGVGLIGIRMGATFAARVAAEREVASLALWEPCASGAHYGREMEILASAAPGASTPAGASWLDAGGYVLSRETLADLAGLDLSKLTPKGSPPVLLLNRSDRRPSSTLAEHLSRCGCDVSVAQPPGFKEMMMYPEASVPAVEGFERIREWTVERFMETEAGPPAHLPTSIDLGVIRREAVVFGPDRRLFGVISEPRSRAETSRAPGVLFLTGGIVPRTSVNRMYVTLADELATRGHRTLRFDVSGIAESGAAPGHAGKDPYPPSLMDDVREALSVLREDRADRPVWLVGLCSGAFAAFRRALDDPHVEGIVLLNPLHYAPMKGSERPDTERSTSVEEYGRAVLDLRRWKRLLSDRQRIRRTAGGLARSVRRRIARASDRLHRRRVATRTLADELHTLQRRRTRVHVVFAAGDPGQKALEQGLGGSFAPLATRGVHLLNIEGADHTFNASTIRNELIAYVLESIFSAGGAGGEP